jgi:hypothetical protein
VCTSVCIAPVDGRTETVEGEEARMNGQILGPEGSLYVPCKGRGIAACKGRIDITASGYADSVFGTGAKGQIDITASDYADSVFGTGGNGQIYITASGYADSVFGTGGNGQIHITASGYADSVFGTGVNGRICITACGYAVLHFGTGTCHICIWHCRQSANRHNR